MWQPDNCLICSSSFLFAHLLVSHFKCQNYKRRVVQHKSGPRAHGTASVAQLKHLFCFLRLMRCTPSAARFSTAVNLPFCLYWVVSSHQPWARFTCIQNTRMVRMHIRMRCYMQLRFSKFATTINTAQLVVCVSVKFQFNKAVITKMLVFQHSPILTQY